MVDSSEFLKDTVETCSLNLGNAGPSLIRVKYIFNLYLSYQKVMSERTLARSVRNNIHLDLNFSTKFTIILTTSIGFKSAGQCASVTTRSCFQKKF